MNQTTTKPLSKPLLDDWDDEEDIDPVDIGVTTPVQKNGEKRNTSVAMSPEAQIKEDLRMARYLNRIETGKIDPKTQFTNTEWDEDEEVVCPVHIKTNTLPVTKMSPAMLDAHKQQTNATPVTKMSPAMLDAYKQQTNVTPDTKMFAAAVHTLLDAHEQQTNAEPVTKMSPAMLDAHEQQTDIIEEEDDEDTPTYTDSWADMGLADDIHRNILRLGLEEPLPVQQITPWLIANLSKNVLVEASTGTGKTFGFAIPAVSLVIRDVQSPQVVIMAPTKLLIDQIYKDFCKLVENTEITVAMHVGTSTKDQNGNFTQDRNAKAYTSRQVTDKKGRRVAVKPGSEQIVIGTSTRLLSLFSERGARIDNQNVVLSPSYVHQVILDECDALIPVYSQRNSMSEAIDALIGEIDTRDRIKHSGIFSDNCRHMWFSATVTQNDDLVAKAEIIDAIPIILDVKRENHQIFHRFVAFHDEEFKMNALIDILKTCGMTGQKFVFAESKVISRQIYNDLRKEGFAVSICEGTMKASESTEQFRKFSSCETNIMVCTNVLSRGIDITQAQLVISFDVPRDSEIYKHRAGRGGRGNRSGVSVVFANVNGNEKPQDIRRLENDCMVRIDELNTDFFRRLVKM